MIDVDRFKEINDTQGHHIGDAVLREISKLLKAIVRASDVVIRLGGDEFLVILPETAIEADVVRTRIERGVEFWNRTQKLTPFPVTLSIGSSYWTAQGLETVEDAMSRADAQMYARKRKAKKAARAADDGE